MHIEVGNMARGHGFLRMYWDLRLQDFDRQSHMLVAIDLQDPHVLRSGRMARWTKE